MITHALRSFGFPILRTDWASYRHHSDSAILQEAWDDAGLSGVANMAHLEAEYRAAFDAEVIRNPIQEISGSTAFLAELDQTEWVACFATGSLRYGALRKLEILGVAVDIDLFVTASEHQTRENIVGAAIDRAVQKHAISRPNRVLSIGDGLWDLLTAQSLGIEFLGIGVGLKAELLLSRGARVTPDFTLGMKLLDSLEMNDSFVRIAHHGDGRRLHQACASSLCRFQLHKAAA